MRHPNRKQVAGSGARSSSLMAKLLASELLEAECSVGGVGVGEMSCNLRVPWKLASLMSGWP